MCVTKIKLRDIIKNKTNYLVIYNKKLIKNNINFRIVNEKSEK